MGINHKIRNMGIHSIRILILTLIKYSHRENPAKTIDKPTQANDDAPWFKERLPKKPRGSKPGPIKLTLSRLSSPLIMAEVLIHHCKDQTNQLGHNVWGNTCVSAHLLSVNSDGYNTTQWL